MGSRFQGGCDSGGGCCPRAEVSRGGARRSSEFSASRCRGERGTGCQTPPLGAPGAEEGSWARPSWEFGWGVAGMATAVFRPLPLSAGRKGATSPPSFWLSLTTPSLLLTARVFFPDVLTPNTRLSPRPAAPSSLPRTRFYPPLSPPFHSKTSPLLRSPSPGLSSGFPRPDPLPHSSVELRLCPQPSNKRVSPITPTFSQTPSELDPASPRTQAVPESSVDSVLCCSPLSHSPGSPQPRWLSSLARPLGLGSRLDAVPGNQNSGLLFCFCFLSFSFFLLLGKL